MKRQITIRVLSALLALGMLSSSAAKADGTAVSDIVRAAEWLIKEKAQSKQVDAIIGATLPSIQTVYEANYAENAQFNDPTISVTGRAAIIAHLQDALTRITIDGIRRTNTVHGPDGVWIVTYEMDAHLSFPVAPGVILPLGEQFTLKAATELKFQWNSTKRKYEVIYHRDYWDQLAAFAQIQGLVDGVYARVGQWFGEQLTPPPAP